MAELIGVRTGTLPPATPGKDVPRARWKFLLSARQAYCNEQFQYDCKELLFYIDDGRANNFFGYPDEVTYWREGLCLEPEAVPFAENYLRTRKARLEAGIDGEDWRQIPFDKAVERGKEYQRLDAKAPDLQPVGTNQYSDGCSNNATDRTPSHRGTTAEYAIRRLRKDRPDIHARVLAGEISAHAGMVEAGFRKKAVRKKLTPFERLANAVAKLSDIEWQKLKCDEDQRRRKREAAA